MRKYYQGPGLNRKQRSLIALLVPFLTALVLILSSWAMNPGYDTISGRLMVFLIVFVFSGVPFALLLFLSVQQRFSWILGAFLTAVIWGWVFLDMIVRRGEGGANIGLGLAVLVSPLVISALCLAAAHQELRGRH